MTNKEADGWMNRALDAEQALARACSDIVRLRRLLQRAAERAETGRPLGDELAAAVVAETGARPPGRRVCVVRGHVPRRVDACLARHVRGVRARRGAS